MLSEGLSQYFKPDQAKPEPTQPKCEPKAKYLTGHKGYTTWCMNCTGLIDIEETGSITFPIRILCSKEKCEKTERKDLGPKTNP